MHKYTARVVARRARRVRALPGSVHDKKAEWIWASWTSWRAPGLVTLADKGYQGAAHVKIPFKGRNKPESQKEANRAHARFRSLSV